MKDKGLFHTALCNLLGIEYPIIQGAMARIGGPALVAAVSNAGGLGVLPTWGVSPDKLRQSIAETRTLTKKPFGVNIVPIGQSFTESRANIVIDEGITIVTTGRGDPTTPVVSLLKRYNIKVLPVVPTARHAIRLEEEGADAIIASGSEGGGHIGDISSLPLIPLVADAVKIPVVAAGGISDSRGFVAALALGACGIQMGTRFYATREANANPSELSRILDASAEDTIVTTAVTGKPSRILYDQVTIKWLQLKKQTTTVKELPEDAIVGAGQVLGMIKEIEDTKDIIDRILKEAAIICHRIDLLAIAQDKKR